MADVVASSLVRLVCNKMGTELMKEYGLFSGADKELKKLKGILETIRDVLEDAESRQEKDKALRGWLRKLKDAAFEIDDLLDDAESEAVKSENKKQAGIIGKVHGISSYPNSVKFKYTIAHRAKDIRKKLDEIAAERSKFHLQERATTESNREDSILRESSSFVVESEVYGREKEKENIIEFIINTESENGVEVMAIVGMGGLGKTTIAQLLYNDERVRNRFDNLIWVSVNNNFDIRRITNDMLESITKNKSDLRLELVQHKLKEQLGGRRFFLVLDDVWNENSEKWDQLKMALLTIGAHGIEVIVTTRSTRVASIMGIVEPYILTGLSEKNCWLLFERRAFPRGTSNGNSNLVTIGKQIVKKCGGVPLAAKVIGSLMQFKRSESEWLAIKDNDIWNLPNVKNEILPSLMLSYMNLPSHLKQCFTYCALFPKNSEILSSELVQLWIAEGFIQSSDSMGELEDVAEEYVEDLRSRSLFQGRSPKEIEIHDLIHDLANYFAGEECSIVNIDGTTTLRENTRYSSFVCGNVPLSIPLKSLGVPAKLRTFYRIHASNFLDNSLGQEQKKDKKDFLNVACSNFVLLRALCLSYYPLKELPTSLKNLRHLRYLNLSCTKLEILPPHISHLYNLRTLNLSFCYHLEELSDLIGELCNLIILNLNSCSRLHSLPVSIVKLTNLKSLELTCCSSLRELPSKIGEMRSLAHLDVYECHLECIPCGIGDLCHLRRMQLFVPGGKTKCSMRELGALDLKDELEIKYLENVKSPEEAKEAKLICKNDLRKLSLGWNKESYEIQMEEEGKSIDECIDISPVEQILENLQPSNMLSDLDIWGYQGKILPKWLMYLDLPNLVSITLANWMKCEILPEFKKFECLKELELINLREVRSLNSLGQVPSLEVLTLEYLPLIKCLGGEFYGGDVAFTRLVKLELKSMPELEEWSEVAAGFEFFPRLAELRIILCPKLKKLPSTFSTVRSLKVTMDDLFIVSSLRSRGISAKMVDLPYW